MANTKSRILFPFEAFDILSSTTFSGVLYGMIFLLYCLCASSSYLNLQNPDKRRQAGFSLGYISFVFFCATGYLALRPLEYEISFDSAISPLQTASGILGFTIEVSTMAIQIRRLWIIWSATRYAIVVTVLPVLLLLAYVALEIPMNSVSDVVFQSIPSSSWLAMGPASFIILASMTTLVTGLIAARLLFARRRLTKAMGMADTASASPYLSIVAMVVESYALESAWSLAAAISIVLKKPSHILFEQTDPMVKIITYFLILYRVGKGQGWNKQTQEKLTSLQFNCGAQSTTDDATGLSSQAPATTTIPRNSP